jgi:hypothetical protein
LSEEAAELIQTAASCFLLQSHHEGSEGSCLPDCDHVFVLLCTRWNGFGREDIAAVTLTHFDQGSEQGCTDSGKEDGQNASSRVNERSGLEKQWARGDNVSLRTCGLPCSAIVPFFDRLLKFQMRSRPRMQGGSNRMFLILFFILLMAWLLGFLAFHVAGALIHVLLIVAVISLIVHFVRGRSGS